MTPGKSTSKEKSFRQGLRQSLFNQCHLKNNSRNKHGRQVPRKDINVFKKVNFQCYLPYQQKTIRPLTCPCPSAIKVRNIAPKWKAKNYSRGSSI